MTTPYYAPEFQVKIDDMPVPAALRASIMDVNHQSGLEGADRVELSLANENLRWLDDPLLALDKPLTLSLGYAPDPLTQVFVGEIVGQQASFPGGGMPTLRIDAQDRRQRLQTGTRVRWFAVPTGCGHVPIPDPVVAGLVSAENGLIPIIDPIGATLAVLLGGAQTIIALGNPTEMQKVIRKQAGQSDHDFLRAIAQENGWEMLVDHSGPLGGHQLRFMSPLDHVEPDLTLKYGRSLIDFTPRVSNVGQVLSVGVRLWVPDIKMEFTAIISWDWDRSSLNLSITPGFGLPGSEGTTLDVLTAACEEAKTEIAAQVARAKLEEQQKRLHSRTATPELLLVDEPVSLISAPRVILSKLIPKLNRRLTGSGSTIGDPRIRAGAVLRLEGIGEQFGGLYRVTSATHSLGGGGYRTQFEARKEIWFGSIPLLEQGAVPVKLQGQQLLSIG